ncbi:tryptophan--tRNA ligase [Candidatus Phytoplasma ziziphi]|uniref:Tryptophan--tRNA ligase n=1 Tax=Ziziphus jujuba witches'-broom phytoplasma TaxID=135727 RepID=A0A660HNV0_ZIZJU|nr:tryptophan--tRNA ligase [Candidatus Phytoplasma ziziphi]AYJ01559.1 tryptophan--tRNA ligase [Candidatus Phytoplasma ziziphi]
MFKEKKRLITGIKPTGVLTLGNYLGVIKPLILFQNEYHHEYDIYFFIADLHSLTSFQEPSLLKKTIREMIYLCLASGLDLNKTNLFIQSEVPQHTYLNYIMESNTYLGELSRMIQFKEKKSSLKQVRTSLMTYPILMSSDILLYDADFVLLGQDQKQHLELTRVLANRFNNLYGNTFVVPEFLQLGSMIKSLTDPQKKMSKSSSENSYDDKGCIYILENLNIIKQKILKSVTDSGKDIRYDLEEKLGLSNLLTIYSSLKNCDLNDTIKYFQNFSYKTLKEEIADSLVEEIKIIQEKFYDLEKNVNLEQILQKGTKKATIIADRKIKEVRKKLGIDIN